MMGDRMTSPSLVELKQAFSWVLRLAVMAVAVLAAPGNAAPTATADSPHQAIENTTQELIKVINEAKTYFDEDPDRYYREIERIIDPLIDFRTFSLSVMGKYGSRKLYQSLKTKEEKKRFNERVDRFSATFKEGLVKTYGKGLLAFNGQKIEVLPLKPEEIKMGNNGRAVQVVQLIYGGADKPYVVRYKMKQNKAKKWQLKNVVIEAINIGQVYRSQFYSSMEKYHGDIDKVIDNWTVDPKDVSGEVKSASL